MKNNLNRREFLQRASASGAALAAAAHGVDAAPSGGTRPNILVIMSDEHTAAIMGCAGNDIVQTPNLDALAGRGVLFDGCYCNSPLCVPSRSSFTSGKYISRVGAWANSCWLPSDDMPSLPRLLNEAGYESLLCGKMHYDATRRYGFKDLGGNMNDHIKTGRGGRRRADDLRPKPGISNRFEEFYPSDESKVLSHDRQVTSGAVDFFNNRTRNDKPFFLLAGYLAPHFPLIVPGEFWEPYKGKVPMPEIPKGHLDDLPLNYKHLRIGFNNEDVPDDMVRKGRELYYGLTQWVDVEIGKVLDALGNSEVADNTVVIYTTDHGENLGEHGLWWKNCMYEHAARVPLIVSWPARWRGGQRRTEACSLVDVVQTIAEMGGAEAPGDWDGDSLVPWLDDSKTEWKDKAVSEYYSHNIASGFAMIRMGHYKYVYHTPMDEEHPSFQELYDLKEDPGEFKNVATKRRHRDRVESMHVALVEELGEEPDKTERRCREDYRRGYARPGAEKKKLRQRMEKKRPKSKA